MSGLPTPPTPVVDDFNELLNPEPRSETCGWCGDKIRHSEQGQYEVHWKYKGIKENPKGWYICLRCKNNMDDLIQDKVVRTWMKVKARAEKPCCGG